MSNQNEHFSILASNDFSHWKVEVTKKYRQHFHLSVSTSPIQTLERSAEEKKRQVQECVDLLIPGIERIIFYPQGPKVAEEIKEKEWIVSRGGQLVTQWRWSSFLDEPALLLDSDSSESPCPYLLECSIDSIDWDSFFSQTCDPTVYTNFGSIFPKSAIQYAKRKGTAHRAYIALSSSAYTFMDVTIFESVESKERLLTSAFSSSRTTKRLELCLKN